MASTEGPTVTYAAAFGLPNLANLKWRPLYVGVDSQQALVLKCCTGTSRIASIRKICIASIRKICCQYWNMAENEAKWPRVADVK